MRLPSTATTQLWNLEPAARNNLNFAIYTVEAAKPTEFEKYDNVGGGVVRKLAVQTGLDDYRPAPSASVLLRGTVRMAPTERAEPVVTPLSSDLASLLVEYAAGGRKVAVLVGPRLQRADLAARARLGR